MYFQLPSTNQRCFNQRIKDENVDTTGPELFEALMRSQSTLSLSVFSLISDDFDPNVFLFTLWQFLNPNGHSWLPLSQIQTSKENLKPLFVFKTFLLDTRTTQSHQTEPQNCNVCGAYFELKSFFTSFWPKMYYLTTFIEFL